MVVKCSTPHEHGTGPSALDLAPALGDWFANWHKSMPVESDMPTT